MSTSEPTSRRRLAEQYAEFRRGYVMTGALSDADTLERAAMILEKRSLKQPPGFLLRSACRMLRRQALAIAREHREVRGG